MHHASGDDIVVFFVSLAALLVVARLLGELARRLSQPAVLGEIIAGVLLGPTVFGALAPELQLALFPDAGPAALMREGVTLLGLGLFLLVAGMEVELATVLRQGRTAAYVSLTGMVIPFALGFGAAILWPAALGHESPGGAVPFALFLGAALSISALPVIAKMLMDMRIFRSDLGMIVMAAAIVNDLVGWILFAIVVGTLGEGHAQHLPIWATTVMTLGFTLLMLTVVRWGIHRALPWVQANTSWPGGVITFTLMIALSAGAITEWLGVHAIFGTFMAGVALGDSRHFRPQIRRTLDQFVSTALAPLFFASIGLQVDFVAHFDLVLVIEVTVIATAGKVLGCALGARLGRMSVRESWAVGFALSARGAMEIIFALLALQVGLIDERLFVALVVMALVTSMLGGPLMMAVLRRPRATHLADPLRAGAFVPTLAARSARDAIVELCAHASRLSGRPAEELVDAVWAREVMAETGLGRQVAVPHAALTGLSQPVVIIGHSPAGIDFGAADGRPARLIWLLLTPWPDPDAVQLALVADIARAFKDDDSVEAVLAATSLTEVVALVQAGTAH